MTRTDTRAHDRAISAAQSLGPAFAELAKSAQRDPAVFCQFVLRNEEDGSPIRLAPVHEEWHDILSTHDRVVLWSATELGKSSEISIGRVLWEIGRNPNIRILVLSSAAGGARKIVRALKNYIERSVEFRMVFPLIVPDKSDTTGLWTNEAFIVKRSSMSKDPTVQASGFGGNILGGRYDLIIVDDYLTAENTYSDHLRDKFYSWLKSTVEGRRTRRARLWFVGNAWHLDDAMHRYAGEPQTFSKKFPVRDAAGKLAWEEVWPHDRIDKEIQNRGPVEAPRSMFCDPVADADRRFKEAYIKLALTNGDGIELAYSLAAVPPGWRTVTGVDVAVSKKMKSDRSAIATIAVSERDGTRVLLDLESGKWDGPELVDRIIDANRRFNSLVLVESNACFVPGSMVLTRDRGYVPIEQIRVGDLTWTHRARWRRVTEILVGNARRISPIRASGSVTVRATPNHWFYLREAGRTPGRGGGHYVPVGEPTWISGGFAERRAYAAVAAPRWTACAPEIEIPATGRIGKNKRWGGQRGSDARTLVVDHEMAMLLGLYMAEGHTTPGQVILTLSRKEMYLGKWAAAVFERMDPSRRAAVVKRGSILNVRMCSSALARALKLGVGPDKCLPMAWLGWPLDLRLAMVRGWLLGDGCHRINNRKLTSAASTLSGSTVSRNWAMWVRATLFEAGMRPTLKAVKAKIGRIDGRAIHGKRAWEIMIGPTDVEALIGAGTNIEWKRWGEFVDGRHQRPHSTMHHMEDGHVWAYLREGPGVYEGYEGDVYNLTVAEDHSFTVDDYIVHNAQKLVKQFVNDKSAVPVRAFYTGKNKYDPAFGVESLAIEFSQGKWVLPNRGGEKRGVLATMHTEVRGLVNEMLRYDPRSHTGDRLMALWLAREGARFATSGTGFQKRKRRT
jgi:hypothetical protein